jgi:hypothetical protein
MEKFICFLLLVLEMLEKEVLNPTKTLNPFVQ